MRLAYNGTDVCMFVSLLLMRTNEITLALNFCHISHLRGFYTLIVDLDVWQHSGTTSGVHIRNHIYVFKDLVLNSADCNNVVTK